MPGPFFLAPAAERDSLMKFRPWSLAERGLLALWLSLLLHAALLWLPARLGQPAAHAGLLVRLADAISPVFGAASYQPALKDGVPVKSYKRIRIEPQPAAALPPLSH